MNTNPNICLYFQVHQPYRLRDLRYNEIGGGTEYFDEQKNKEIFRKVAEKCYLPANKLMLDLLNEHEDFRISYSISGVFLDQCEEYGQDVLESFQALAKTGKVEFMAETYYHSLSAIHSLPEFCEQVSMHANKIQELFGSYPRIFRNTELIFSNEIAHIVRMMGFRGILAEGADHILQGRLPNDPYIPPNFHLPESEYWNVIKEKFPDSVPDKTIYVLLKNYRLSDDVAFRFSDKSWMGFPLTTERFTDWILQNHGHSINLFMDYETFGEHQWAETGIFNFLKKMPDEWNKRSIKTLTPSQIIDEWENRIGVVVENDKKEHKEDVKKIVQVLKSLWERPKTTDSPMEKFSVEKQYNAHCPVSWADTERDISAWEGNEIQKAAIEMLYSLEDKVKQSKDPHMVETWRKLQTSDHFYYMCTKYWSDGDVHKYFSPYDSPYEAYRRFSHALQDLQLQSENTN